MDIFWHTSSFGPLSLSIWKSVADTKQHLTWVINMDALNKLDFLLFVLLEWLLGMAKLVITWHLACPWINYWASCDKILEWRSLLGGYLGRSVTWFSPL
jgi:hypothetical protein